MRFIIIRGWTFRGGRGPSRGRRIRRRNTTDHTPTIRKRRGQGIARDQGNIKKKTRRKSTTRTKTEVGVKIEERGERREKKVEITIGQKIEKGQIVPEIEKENAEGEVGLEINKNQGIKRREIVAQDPSPKSNF